MRGNVNKSYKTFNAVYSVKGGCGKTSMSIMLAAYMTEAQNKVCLIDADILGSSMINTFVPIKNEDQIDNSNAFKGCKFINEITDANEDEMFGYKQYLVNSTKIEKYQKKDNVEEDQAESSNNGFDVVFSSPRTKDVDKFRLNSSNGYVPDILHSTFSESFKFFINKSGCFRYVKDIVFDLPPSADGFSNVVFDSVFGRKNKKYKIGKPNDVRNLFIIMNLDSGHILTVRRELKRLLTRTDVSIPDHIFIVLNNMTGVDKEILNKIADNRKKDICNFIKEISNLQEREYKSIYFLVVPYFQKYFQAVSINEGIANEGISKLFNYEELQLYNISNPDKLLNAADDSALRKIIKCKGDKCDA